MTVCLYLKVMPLTTLINKHQYYSTIKTLQGSPKYSMMNVLLFSLWFKSRVAVLKTQQFFLQLVGG